jgi:predicted phosphodiesterase
VRYAVISDIHGNLHALEAVVREITDEGVDGCFCLGDIVGYGAFPNECVRIVQELGFPSVAGNHDYAVLERISVENFNRIAKVSTAWTQETLDRNAQEFLSSLPLVREHGSMSLVHGTLHCPELFDYIQTSYEAFLTLSQTPGKVCFIGHSHVPVAFRLSDHVSYTVEPEIPVPENGKVLVNVGSVGQPRDQNPMSCYAIYDDELEKVWIRRTAYDLEGAIEGIRDRGLPAPLGDRLRFGR